jgi:hypothetical protein
MFEYELPTSVILNDAEHAIRKDGDFRMVLDCFRLLQDTELEENERILACLVVFYDELNDVEDIQRLGDIEEAVKQMFSFFNCGQKQSAGINTEAKVIDWDKDSLMIISAINNVAGKEIRAEKYLHWWTFMAYYMAIGESSLSTVVNIRRKIIKGKKLEKFEQDYVNENPELFKRTENYTKEEQDYLNDILANWDTGGQ